jgi:hypothetical protein
VIGIIDIDLKHFDNFDKCFCYSLNIYSSFIIFASCVFLNVENIPDPSCTAWKDVTLCAFNINHVIHGCHFNDLHGNSKTSMELVMENCSPHIGCRKECLPVARRLKQSSCYRKVRCPFIR